MSLIVMAKEAGQGQDSDVVCENVSSSLWLNVASTLYHLLQ